MYTDASIAVVDGKLEGLVGAEAGYVGDAAAGRRASVLDRAGADDKGSRVSMVCKAERSVRERVSFKACEPTEHTKGWTGTMGVCKSVICCASSSKDPYRGVLGSYESRKEGEEDRGECEHFWAIKRVCRVSKIDRKDALM